MLHKTTKEETKIAVFATIDNDNADMLTLLLDKGASLEIANEDGDTPFIYSAKKNKFKCIKVIVDVLEKQHIERQQNTDALFAAIKADDPIGVKKLLIKSLDLSFKNEKGLTPIVYAANMNRWKCVSVIAETYAAEKGDPGDYGSAALFAARGKRYDIVELLLNGPISLTWLWTESENKLCHYAALDNQPNILKQLIQKGASATDKNKKNMTAIHAAAKRGHWECVEVVLDYSSLYSDAHLIAAQYGAALYCAVNAKRLNLATRLIAKGTRFNWRRPSDKAHILEIAVEQNYPEMVELLTQDKKKNVGMYPLFCKLLPIAKPECGCYIAEALPKIKRLTLLDHIFTLEEDERKTALMQALDEETPLHKYLLIFEQTFTERHFTQQEISADTFEARIKTELKRLKNLEKQTSELKTASVYADDTSQDLSAMPLLSAESKSESQSKQSITATLTPVYLSTQTWTSQFPSVPKEKPKKPKKQDEPKKETAQSTLW